MKVVSSLMKNSGVHILVILSLIIFQFFILIFLIYELRFFMSMSGYEGKVKTHTGIPLFHSILKKVLFIWIKYKPFSSC